MAAIKFVGMSESYLAKARDRFEAKVDRGGDCHLWTAARTKRGKGYGSFLVAGRCFADGRERRVSAHRVAVYLATGRWHPSATAVLHKCDDPRCVRPGHLVVGTIQSNVDDARSKGRGCWMKAKLKPADVRLIRRLLAEGDTKEAIARRFKVSGQSVHMISVGKLWSWVTDDAA